MSKICPQCKSLMTESRDRSVITDYCDDCGGSFFDFNEMIQVIDSIKPTENNFKEIREGDDKIEHQEPYICPKCNVPMTQKEYAYDSGIHIDFCDKCFSVFLNKGELQAIKDFLLSLDRSDEGKLQYQKGKKIIDDFNLAAAKRAKLEADSGNSSFVTDFFSMIFESL